MRQVIAVVACVVVAACSGFELVTPGFGRLTFEPRAAEHGEWLEQPVVQVAGGAGKAVIQAKLSGPDPCRTLSAELSGGGSERVVTVAVRPSSAEACYQVIGTFEYDAAIRNLRPGDYRLRVIHTYPETGWPTVTAFDELVRID